VENAVEERLVRLLCDLISTESVNPAYPGGERGEAAVADYVESYCRRLGLDVVRQAVLPGRENVLARLDAPGVSGRLGARPTVLFEVHMDTVNLDGAAGLRPEVRDGRVYGRGACDAKGALAAMLGALEVLAARRDDLAVNVWLLGAVDEEYRYRGVLGFLDSGLRVDAAVVAEPTELRVVTAHKGCVRTRISTVGRAAHSSRPDDGVNAIEHMADVVDALRALRGRMATASRRHPLVGSPTLSIGRVWGGTAVNVVPDRCTVEIDRRTVPGEDAAGVLAEIDAALDAVRARVPGLSVEREAPFVADWPLDTPAEAAVVRAAGAACRAAGLPEAPVGVPYGSDASKLQALGGVQSIVFGPGSIAQAHTPDEFVPIADLTRAAQVYAQTVRHLATLFP
jgi:acetylornithine deacetylase